MLAWVCFLLAVSICYLVDCIFNDLLLDIILLRFLGIFVSSYFVCESESLKSE